MHVHRPAVSTDIILNWSGCSRGRYYEYSHTCTAIVVSATSTNTKSQAVTQLPDYGLKKSFASISENQYELKITNPIRIIRILETSRAHDHDMVNAN